MNRFLHRWITDAARATGCEVAQFDSAKAAAIRHHIYQRYDNSELHGALWETLKEDSRKYDPLGWKRIAEYPFQGRVVLFFNASEKERMYAIPSVRELVALLAEAPALDDFYVTNDACDFLICHSHEDILVGAGQAKAWVDSLEYRDPTLWQRVIQRVVRFSDMARLMWTAWKVSMRRRS